MKIGYACINTSLKCRSSRTLRLKSDSNIDFDWQGYSLDEPNNKTILGNKTIPMPPDGQHRVQVFGNDTMGTMYESDIKYFSVDTTPPEISIDYPSAVQEFSDPPAYVLTITEANIDALWYTLNDGADIPFT